MGEGGARRRVPDSAGEVGLGGDDLEDSEEDPIFDSQAPAIKAGELRYNLELER